jgi:hypothetical protein
MGTYKERKKKQKGSEGILSKRAGFLYLRFGGLQRTQKENPFKSEQNQQMIREDVHVANSSILLSLYPKISAIPSGATPIGSTVAHPIEISRQKEIARNFGYIAKQDIDYSHREVSIKSQKG